MIVRVPVEALLNRLGMTMDLGVFENLQVTKDPEICKVNVRVKPEWFQENRLAAKQTLDRIRSKARQQGLDARYEPRGRWLVIGPRLGR